MTTSILPELVELSRELAREDRELAILGEGNTSADCGDGSFWVKASGSRMADIGEDGFTRVRYDDVFALMEQGEQTQQAINAGLEAIRLDPAHARPSVETFLHALCLKEGGARWVGHTHTTSVLRLLCSRAGAEPFLRHLYPDVVVVCGRHIAVVPYVDPGLTLAVAVRDALTRFRADHGRGPKLLLMVNHGPVALGQSAREVFNIMLMADKWARVLYGTYALGGPAYMPDSEADRIDGRLDEDYRRKRLG